MAREATHAVGHAVGCSSQRLSLGREAPADRLRACDAELARERLGQRELLALAFDAAVDDARLDPRARRSSTTIRAPHGSTGCATPASAGVSSTPHAVRVP